MTTSGKQRCRGPRQRQDRETGERRRDAAEQEGTCAVVAFTDGKGDPKFDPFFLRGRRWGTRKPVKVKRGKRCKLEKDLGSGFGFNLEHWRRKKGNFKSAFRARRSSIQRCSHLSTSVDLFCANSDPCPASLQELSRRAALEHSEQPARRIHADPAPRTSHDKGNRVFGP